MSSYLKWLFDSVVYYVSLLNVFNYVKKYNDYKIKKEKLSEYDLKSVNEFNKKELEKEKAEHQNKLKLENEKIESQKKKANFIYNLKSEIDKEFNSSVNNWINDFGIYSYKCVSGVQAVVKKQDFNLLSEKKMNLIMKDSDSYLFESYNMYNDRNNLRHNLFDINIKHDDSVLLHMFRQLPYQVIGTDKQSKEYDEVINIFKNIVILKTKINIEKKKNVVYKKNFLARVLRVLLYVEDREAETLNEQLAKAFFYTRDVNYNFRVRSSNIKVRSLEWTIPSPPPLHTFYVPVRTIVTNDRFYNYKKGKRLLENNNYDFTETPSIFQKGMRKLTKTFYLFINYITYAVGINKFDKDANSWYSGSYNVEESQEYSHTVEYVSQSVRYPHKHLSKHLPFSAGLHNNTISVDLLVTPDKSNTVIFGENKNYVSKPAYLNTSNILKPLFVLGDRTSNLSKVNIQSIETNYNNYLKTLELINNELFTVGDGPYINYYLPNIQTSSINFFFWSNVTLEDPSVANYNFASRGSFFYVKDQFDSVDLNCLSMDINEKNTNSLSYLPSSVKKLFVDVANKLSLFKEKHNKYLSDWYDSQDFSWSTQFIYTNFYIPFKVSRKVRKHSFFYRYLLVNYIVNPIIGKGWLAMIKADIFLLKHLFTLFKK